MQGLTSYVEFQQVSLGVISKVLKGLQFFSAANGDRF